MINISALRDNLAAYMRMGYVSPADILSYLETVNASLMAAFNML